MAQLRRAGARKYRPLFLMGLRGRLGVNWNVSGPRYQNQREVDLDPGCGRDSIGIGRVAGGVVGVHPVIVGRRDIEAGSHQGMLTGDDILHG